MTSKTKLNKAIKLLKKDKPFMAHYLNKIRFKSNKRIQVIGSSNGIIYYNSKWVKETSINSLANWLSFEAQHHIFNMLRNKLKK